MESIVATYDDYQVRGDYRRSEGRSARDAGYGRGDYGRSDFGDRGRRFESRGQDRARDRGGRDNERFDNYDEDRDVAIDETEQLISSSKVEGTRVYSRRGERLGTVESFMVNKRSGRVEYAVLSFGGFLGLGHRHYPLPWNLLTYDVERGGYVVDLDPRDLERAPSFAAGAEHRFSGGYDRHVDSYYGIY